jgi:hypothetical protein
MGEPAREVVVGWAQEDLPASWDAAIFLAGPTPRDRHVASWRPAAVDLLRRRWLTETRPDGEPVGGRLVVFVPEGRGGGFDGGWSEQIAWEDACLNASDVIAFWIPRDLTTMPGLTTNVEWGRWESSGKVVLGAPPDAPRMRYLRHYAARYQVPTAQSLEATIDAALALLHHRLTDRSPN